MIALHPPLQLVSVLGQRTIFSCFADDVYGIRWLINGTESRSTRYLTYETGNIGKLEVRNSSLDYNETSVRCFVNRAPREGGILLSNVSLLLIQGNG